MAELRVTMLVKLYPPWIGGVESHVAQLSAAIVRANAGVRVSVVAGQESAGLARHELREGVPVHRATTIARVARTPICMGIRALIRDSSPDILHFHSPFPWGEMVAPLDRRVRVVVTYHHDVVRQARLKHLYAPVLNRLLRRADRIIAWSPELVESSDTLRRFRDKVVISPGGIDTSRFAPSAASRARARELRLRYSPQRPMVLFVGRLVYYKGVEFLLRAMTRLNATLMIVGNGSRRADLVALSEDQGLTHRVHFRTDVSDADLPAYYQASDVLVLPSIATTEAFGLVQAEAHASGLPTICTALPTGVTHVNEHGVTGLVVPPRDSEALALALERLLRDSSLRARMGEIARARALAQFDIGRCARDVTGLYRELMRTSSGLN